MACFYCKTIEARQQACELQVGYVSLRSVAAEVQEVMRDLRSMSSFEMDIWRLKQVRQKMIEQSERLRAMVRTLHDVVRLYQTCEEKNLRELDGPVIRCDSILKLDSTNSFLTALHESSIDTHNTFEVFRIGEQPMLLSKIISMFTTASPRDKSE